MSQTVPHHQDQEGARLTPPPSFGGPPAGPDAAQAESVSAWLRWHAVELVGVGVPAALALLVSAWFVALAVPAAGLWAAQETRHARQRAQIHAADRGALTSPDATASEENDR